MIYADNAATSGWIPEEVIHEAVLAMAHPGNPGHSASQSSLQAARNVYRARKKVASFFKASSPDQVVFTSGITEALNLVIHSWVRPGDEVIVSCYEHNSVLRPLHAAKARVIVTDGTAEEIEKAITSRTRAVIINHVSNVSGHVQDLKAIADVCRAHGVLFAADSAQSAGVLEVDMEQGMDVLCFAGHKGLHALQGVGGLVIRKGLVLKPLKTGGTGTHSFEMEFPYILPDVLEAGTLNVPGILSLAAGIEWVEATGRQNIEAHLKNLSSHMKEGLSSIEGVEIYEKEAGSCGLVTVSVKGMDDARAADLLQEKYGIETRAGVHCAPLFHKKYKSQGALRFSFGWQNTLEEVDACVQALKEIAS